MAVEDIYFGHLHVSNVDVFDGSRLRWVSYEQIGHAGRGGLTGEDRSGAASFRAPEPGTGVRY
jgi:hypothetical protein